MLPTNSPTRMFFLPIFFVHANSHYAFSHKKIKKKKNNNNITVDPTRYPTADPTTDQDSEHARYCYISGYY